MKLEEMKAVAENRNGRYWGYDGDFRICIPTMDGEYCFRMEPEDAKFIEMVANNFEKLMAVVEAASAINEKRSEEEITDYPLENFFDLHKALRELEED